MFAVALTTVALTASALVPVSGGTSAERSIIRSALKVVDAGVVTGGGFITFDPPNGRYSGGIELKIEEIVVKAYGLLASWLAISLRRFATSS